MARNIQIGGRTYTPEDIQAGKHENDPNIDTDAEAHHVTNVCHGENTGIQAGRIEGGISFG